MTKLLSRSWLIFEMDEVIYDWDSQFTGDEGGEEIIAVFKLLGRFTLPLLQLIHYFRFEIDTDGVKLNLKEVDLHVRDPCYTMGKLKQDWRVDLVETNIPDAKMKRYLGRVTSQKSN